MKKDKTVGIQKIAALFDAGTFVETGAFVKRADGTLTGVVSGYGAIGGKLVYAFSQDSDRQKGAFDMPAAEKLVSLYTMAMKNGAPVIGLFDSAGAMVKDGATVMSAYGRLLRAVSDASGVIPQIAVITGVCAGLSATVAAMFDVCVTVKDQSALYVNAPFLIGREIGSGETVAANGLSSVLADNETEAFTLAQRLIEMLPANNAEGVEVTSVTDDVNRLVTVDGLTGGALVESLADAGAYIALGEAYAPELFAGLMKLGGVTCGVLASNNAERQGVLGADAAKKAAKLVSFCDSFSIPVITLVDSVGVDCTKEAENAPLAAQLGKLAMTYATAETAKITAVIGKAYGASFTLMGSKALGADMVYALPDATISVMDPAAAVAFLWNDRITEETTRADLVREWKATEACAEAAAADGSIDDVIDARELRKRLCSAVYMLLMKRDEKPVGRHCNLPL